jgi:hypothetical protein
MCRARWDEEGDPVKKVFAWLLVATLIGGTVLFGFLYASVKQRQQTIAARAPLSVQDFNRLVNDLKDRGGHPDSAR